MMKEQNKIAPHTSRNIICISTNKWNGFWFRKQHFMWRLGRIGYKILYVDPPLSVIDSAHFYKEVFGHNDFFVPRIEQINSDILLLTLPPRLPFSYSNIFMSKLNYKWYAQIINREAQKIGFTDYILWLYRPEYFSALFDFDYKSLVFDLTDDLAAYCGVGTQRYFYMKNCIKGLAGKSDLMFTTAGTLYEMYSALYSDKVYYIPNGFDSKLFSIEDFILPNDMKCIPRPIVGFTGVLFNFLDYDLIAYIASRNPYISFVLVGPVESSAKKSIDRLKNYKNTYLLGRKPKEDISHYIHSFDVCINPFKIDEVSRSVNPLKIYEYLACGKPVVSTNMESLKFDKLISNEIDFATDYFTFDKLVKEKITNGLSREEKIRKRMQVVQDYSWDKLFHKLLTIIQEHGLAYENSTY